MTALYWWNGKANFGDSLSPLLVEHFSDITVEWSPPSNARLVSCGSVLDSLPSWWRGEILGSGFLANPRPLWEARAYAVRGELTARALTRTDIALGDPALLCDELVSRSPVEYDLGVVPHWSDMELAERILQERRRFGGKWSIRFIRPSQLDPLEVVRQITSCRKIVSSSLHGIVVADAFGIPRRAERFPRMFSPYEGGEFKWHDYASAIRTPLKFGEVQEPCRGHVERAQQELFDAFDLYGRLAKRATNP